MTQNIGAHVLVQDTTGHNPNHTVYVSFGDYDEDTDTDTHGVRDIRIAYYMTPEQLRNGATTPDGYYSVISWEYETKTEDE